MATVVVPFRGTDAKTRLEPLGRAARARLARAMLDDVVVAAAGVGPVFVVSPEPLELAATLVADPRRGQGAAVRTALGAAAATGAPPPFVVVNADLPCATPRDLLALAGAVPADGLALAAAADGTTNALALFSAEVFEPLYGPGSAARFAALGPSRRVNAPNLMDDVDTIDDLVRVARRLGSHTERAWAALRAEAEAA
jgi:2-phospho-L-lactate/phosphoenolpyruvate guanylyltransferase